MLYYHKIKRCVLPFFKKNDEPDLMRVEVDNQIYCYMGTDEKDLGGD